MLDQEPHSSGDRGWIINLSSIYGLVGAARHTTYCTSKGAVLNMVSLLILTFAMKDSFPKTRSMALSYAPHQIHVNCINPGFIETPMSEDYTAQVGDPGIHERLKNLHPWGRVGHADEIAKAAVFLAGDGASFVTGHALVVDGGYTAQ